jgi:nicotinamide mononucleotide transporter
MEFFEQIWEGILATTWLESLGVLTGVTYVLLAAKKLIACWAFAIVSTSIYIYLCYTSSLYIESGLQVFYLVMGVYGWIKWSQDQDKELPIQRWSINNHLINILISSIVTLFLGFVMSTYTTQESPYLDSFTTIFSLAATFMVTQRVLGNWIYWVVIDLGLAVLYSSRELYLTGVQYAIFAVVAGFAFYSWSIYYSKQKIEEKS